VLEVLENYDNMHINEPSRNVPLDIFLRYFFLQHKNEYDASSRTQIVELVYTMQRYKGYLNAITSRK
jgi:hypothetical protein